MDWEKLADKETIRKAIEAVRSRGISAELVEKREDALQRLREIIPA